MNEQYMDAMNYGDESDHDLISTEMLEDINDRIQTHQNVNKREPRCKYLIVLSKGNPNGKEQ